ncbi:MAG: NAD(P)/FAD-dependent oxidoreductase [Flavobacteriaceae bacterium]
MNWSFWEEDIWFKDIDLAVVGAGIVGLNTAIEYKRKFPEKKVIVLEKGALPEGASTKNAGFACFGSVSEILSDLESHSEKEVQDLVESRWKGLNLLRANLGDEQIEYEELGGFEVFEQDQKELYDRCLSEIPYINRLLWPIFRTDVFSIKNNNLGLNKTLPLLIKNKFEGQIHTGKMMQRLISIARGLGIQIFYGMQVDQIQNQTIILNNGAQIEVLKTAICVNGFGSKFLSEELKPARAQVLISSPIKDLKIKGTFHLDQGYFYFRNVGDRILLGGGRNLNFEGETTTEMELTDQIQNRLDELLKEVILPNIEFKVERRWSGIMGVGPQKKPIIKKISEHQYCAVRLGGMGVAIGSQVGSDLADLIIQNS